MAVMIYLPSENWRRLLKGAGRNGIRGLLLIQSDRIATRLSN